MLREKLINRIKDFDFVKNSKYTFMVSIIVILVGLGSFIIKGGFELGIDFAGGKNIRVKVDQSVAADSEKIRHYLAASGVTVAITSIGSSTAQEYFISFQEENNASQKINESLNSQIGKGKWALLSEDYVGPKIGNEFRKIALQAAIISFLLILIYIGFRFEFKFGLAGVLALIHDILIPLGFISLLNLKFDISLMAALLTLIGYSINDTIVIYDRIREEGGTVHSERSAYISIINHSIVKTLSRTVLTVFTVMMAVVMLAVFGGEELRPMSIVLLIGLVSGTYSSIFVASPLLVFYDKIMDKKKKKVKTA